MCASRHCQAARGHHHDRAVGRQLLWRSLVWRPGQVPRAPHRKRALQRHGIDETHGRCRRRERNYAGPGVVNRYESNQLNTALQALEMLDKLNAPGVKVHLDTYHMNIEETDF